MSMRKIQNKVLPSNWLEKIEKFDVENSSLSSNNKILASRIINSILKEKNNSLTGYFHKPIINYIIFNYPLNIDYDDIPINLFSAAIEETKGEKGLNLTRKLHSVFIEFITYKELLILGYQIDDYKRSEGSCDLIMSKDNEQYNFEVKFKESVDISGARYFDYIDGMSYLSENTFLRGTTLEIYCNLEAPNYKEQKAIFEEIDSFINGKLDIFNGEYIQIFDVNKRTKATRDVSLNKRYISSLHISSELTDIEPLDKLIQKLFIDNNGHITKMKNKSKSFKNFKGCLVWSIPYHKNVDIKNAEIAFNKLQLAFDLHIFLNVIGQGSHNFIVKAKCTTSTVN